MIARTKSTVYNTSMDNQNNNKALTELENHLRFESLLAELSARFVRISMDEVDQEIQESLRRIAENLDLDHVGLGEITPDGRDFFSTYQYAKPGTKLWQGRVPIGRSPPADANAPVRAAVHHA